MSQPDREEAQRDRQGDVAKGLGPLAGPQKVERLQAEGGEGRIAPAHAHDEKRARFQSRQPGSAPKGIARRQKTDEERSRHVHGNRAPGERIPERAGNQVVAPVAPCAADGAAERNPEIDHARPRLPPRILAHPGRPFPNT